MKSVIRSSMLRGSSTKVGKVTFDRSIPTLDGTWKGRKANAKSDNDNYKLITQDSPQLRDHGRDNGPLILISGFRVRIQEKHGLQWMVYEQNRSIIRLRV